MEDSSFHKNNEIIVTPVLVTNAMESPLVSMSSFSLKHLISFISGDDNSQLSKDELELGIDWMLLGAISIFCLIKVQYWCCETKWDVVFYLWFNFTVTATQTNNNYNGLIRTNDTNVVCYWCCRHLLCYQIIKNSDTELITNTYHSTYQHVKG